jgi:lysophospholipase L1-like esterase
LTRSPWPNVALAATSVAAVLLVLEAGFRLAGVASRPEPAAGRLFDGAWTTLLDCYPSNPRGYFDLDLRQKGTRARYRPLFGPRRYDEVRRFYPWAVESRYNARGFRDEPLGPKPPGTKRVLVLGDSFTEGEGVKQEDTAVRVLERLLRARGNARVEVRNCGRRGLDFPELLRVFEEIEPLEPDLVVYALTLNDAVQSPAFRARQGYVNDWILDREHEPDASSPLPPPRSFAFAFFARRVGAWRLGRETTRWYLDMWTDANPGWRRTQELVLGMQGRLRARGVPLLVATWPLLVDLEGRYPFPTVHETIRRLCLAGGIAHRDLLPALQGRKSASLWVHPVDRHPNEIAQRLAAEALAPDVERLLGLARRP